VGGTLQPFVAGHVETFRRVLGEVDAGAVDTVIGVFLSERAGMATLHGEGDEELPGEAGRPGGPGERPIVGALAVDGKAQRGAR
jgi:hypothetical protein